MTRGADVARRLETWVVVAGAGFLAAGGAWELGGSNDGARVCWSVATGIGILAGAWWAWSAARRHHLGVDVLALAAQIGTLVVGEQLAGAVITVMLGSGRLLEVMASRRADRDLIGLLGRVPPKVHRRQGDSVTDPPLDEVRAGDLLVVLPGEVVPVDGLVESGPAVLDESALTGEAIPSEHAVGDFVRSGTVNGGGSFELRCNTTAVDSTYAGIVRLVDQARSQSAPFVRLADRAAVWFLGVSATIALAAAVGSGSLARAVAVLVVATPCPLILAAPVAFVSGVSSAARSGVIVKGGAALERLSRGRILLLDKTGTLTEGRPTVVEVISAGPTPSDQLLMLAASLDQVSPHVLAGAIVRAARARGLPLSIPTEVEEVPAHGVRGRVGDLGVAVGKASWILPAAPPSKWVRSVQRRADLDGALTMFVSVGGEPAGAIILEDPIRPDAPRTIRRLRTSGIDRIVMVTGDRSDVAETVGSVIGVDQVLSERSPVEKVEAVATEHRLGMTVMVGDGVNDAPALAMADVGVAIGARGSTASSEAADVVLTSDRLDSLADGITIAHRTGVIARQSVLAGIGLSLIAMVIAALGHLPAVEGAVLQEVIDVAVIVNALRALRPAPPSHRSLDEKGTELARRFSQEHLSLRPELDQIREAADHLGSMPDPDAVAEVREVHRFLIDELLPHEEAEDSALYPAVAAALGGSDPTGSMSRTHVEIGHLVRRLGRVLDALGPEGPDDDDLAEMRRLLYGLDAILRLHFTQEDESFLSLASVPAVD